MDNRGDILQLCRLCLVKDDVNTPIFEEQGDIRQIFLKISSCLPVKVSRDDKLPKKICDGCSYKLDMLYEFWNTTANAEKQLLTWLGEAGMNAKMTDGTISAVAQQIKPVETVVKQEALDPSDIHGEEHDDKSYMFQQKFTEEDAGPSATVTSNEEEPPPPKRARRTAAVKAQIAMDPDSDEDDDSGEPLTKVEDESEYSEGDDHEPAFVDVPSTSTDDQPGPSGVGKDGGEAPLALEAAQNIVVSGLACILCNRVFPTVEVFQDHSHSCREFTAVQTNHGCNGIFKESVILEISEPISYMKQPNITDQDASKQVQNSSTNENPEHRSSEEEDVQIVEENLSTSNTIEANTIHVINNGSKQKPNVNDLTRFTCPECKQPFYADFELVANCAGPGSKAIIIKCPLCTRVILGLRGQTRWGKPKIVFHRLYQCRICDKLLNSSTNLKYHEENAHLVKTTCKKCRKRMREEDIPTHETSEHKVAPITCPSCQVVFKTDSLWNRHQGRCTGTAPKKEKCEYCYQWMPSSAIKEHVERKHANKEKVDVICEICGKRMIYARSFTLHMRRHTGEKPFPCEYCSKRFISHSDLVQHLRVHTKEKPYECQICQKRFSQKPTLNVHMRYHTGDKPYKCVVCLRKFMNKTLLRNHQCKGNPIE